MQEAAKAVHPPDDVLVMFDPTRRGSPGNLPTCAEMEEYRRIKPLILKMLAEWDRVRGSGGCPVAGMIADGK